MRKLIYILTILPILLILFSYFSNFAIGDVCCTDTGNCNDAFCVSGSSCPSGWISCSCPQYCCCANCGCCPSCKTQGQSCSNDCQCCPSYTSGNTCYYSPTCSNGKCSFSSCSLADECSENRLITGKSCTSSGCGGTTYTCSSSKCGNSQTCSGTTYYCVYDSGWKWRTSRPSGFCCSNSDCPSGQICDTSTYRCKSCKTQGQSCSSSSQCCSYYTSGNTCYYSPTCSNGKCSFSTCSIDVCQEGSSTLITGRSCSSSGCSGGTTHTCDSSKCGVSVSCGGVTYYCNGSVWKTGDRPCVDYYGNCVESGNFGDGNAPRANERCRWEYCVNGVWKGFVCACTNALIDCSPYNIYYDANTNSNEECVDGACCYSGGEYGEMKLRCLFICGNDSDCPSQNYRKGKCESGVCRWYACGEDRDCVDGACCDKSDKIAEQDKGDGSCHSIGSIYKNKYLCVAS